MPSRSKGLIPLVAALALLSLNVSVASATTANFSSSGGYPATLNGVGAYAFSTNATGLICSTKASGELAAKSESISMAPTLTGCNFGMMATEGCTFTFEAGNLITFEESEGSMQIVCPSGKEMVATFGECVMKIPPTEKLSPFTFTNHKDLLDEWFAIEFEVGLNYSQNSNCPGEEGTYEGVLKGLYAIRSSNHAVQVTE